MDSFVFVSCQVGSESTLKNDLASNHPQLSFAFSRPGFVTYKVTDDRFDLTQPLKTYFARTAGFSVGAIPVDLDKKEDAFQQVLKAFPEKRFKHLHVWARDSHVPGERKYEPFHTSGSLELGQQMKAFSNSPSIESKPDLSKAAINRTARQGDLVADLIVLEPDLWFAGWHQATSVATRWPGGVPPLQPREDMVSRAYLKMQEALRWSKLPTAPGDICVELGSAPGGACQALLERDLKVVGVDPANMDPRVLGHPNFKHVRARTADLKRKEFADVRWLVADANVAPTTALDDVEHIVSNRRVNIQGMLLTIKMTTSDVTAEIDSCVRVVRSWGYRHVRVRQLAFNRREVCLFAAKSKGRMRFGRKRPKVRDVTPNAPEVAQLNDAQPTDAVQPVTEETTDQA